MVSVVVPCLVLNDELFGQLRTFVNSIKRKDIQLILVDNGSNSGINYMMDKADIYIHFPKPVGFGTAINAGLKLATGDYIAIGSIDVEYLKGGFEELTKAAFNSIVCPSAKNKGEVIDDDLHPNDTEGATFLMDRPTYDKIKLPEGLYDERYKQGYFEDTDLWRRCDQLEIKLIRSGWVLINHLEGTTQKALGNRDEIFEENKQRFIDKWGENPKWRG